MRPLAHSARDGKPPQTYADHVGNVIGHRVYGATLNAGQVARYRPRDGQAFVQTVGVAAEYHDLGKPDERNQGVLSLVKGRTALSIMWTPVSVIFWQKRPRVGPRCSFMATMPTNPITGFPRLETHGKFPRMRSSGIPISVVKPKNPLAASSQLHRENIPVAQKGDHLAESENLCWVPEICLVMLGGC